MLAAPTHLTRTDEIRAALETVLSRYFEAPQTIRRFHRQRSAYSSSYAVDNVQAELMDGRRLRVILKDLSPNSVFAATHHVRPRFLYQPLREIEVYECIRGLNLGTPICYGPFACHKSETYWLFLERVEGKPLWQFGNLELWKEAARWLARLHNECGFAPRTPIAPEADWLLRYDAKFFRMWLTRAQQYVNRRETLVSTRLVERFGGLVERFDHVAGILSGLPTAFIHGEFYPSNILIRAPNLPARICPVDWETAGIGPAPLDLAALTSGKWSEQCKHDMVKAYWDAVEPCRGWPPKLQDLLREVEVCQLLIAIQWLGWADAWSPPEEHGQDWLKEALRLADKLGI